MSASPTIATASLARTFPMGHSLNPGPCTMCGAAEMRRKRPIFGGLTGNIRATRFRASFDGPSGRTVWP